VPEHLWVNEGFSDFYFSLFSYSLDNTLCSIRPDHILSTTFPRLFLRIHTLIVYENNEK